MRDWKENFICIFFYFNREKEINKVEVMVIYKVIEFLYVKEWVRCCKIIIDFDLKNVVNWCYVENGSVTGIVIYV